MLMRFPNAEFMRTRPDRALGELELWRMPLPRRNLIEYLKPREYRYEWRGRSGEIPILISIDAGREPEEQLAFLDSQALATIASLAEREPALRRETAKRELELARDWANDATLAEAAFADSLRASQVSVFTDATDTMIEIYFEDTAGIFGEHIILVSLDKSGAIVTTGIEG
jgi:hypothetical protein